VDASFLASWILPDEDGLTADRLLGDPEVSSVLAPAHLPVEIGNLLLEAFRRERMSKVNLDLARQTVASLSIVLDFPDFRASWMRGAALAERHGLTQYDAAYLELALRTGSRFATLDKALVRAARAESVVLAL